VGVTTLAACGSDALCYEASVTNLARTSLQSHMVFRDDLAEHQLATVTGDPQAGYSARLAVPV
jgi:hypothetical protein